MEDPELYNSKNTIETKRNRKLICIHGKTVFHSCLKLRFYVELII